MGYRVFGALWWGQPWSGVIGFFVAVCLGGTVPYGLGGRRGTGCFLGFDSLARHWLEGVVMDDRFFSFEAVSRAAGLPLVEDELEEEQE